MIMLSCGAKAPPSTVVIALNEHIEDECCIGGTLLDSEPCLYDAEIILQATGNRALPLETVCEKR